MRAPVGIFLVIVLFLATGCDRQTSTPSAKTPKDLTLIQYGKMREVIGRQQHQGRISLTEAIKQPHLYAVGALEGLTGEVTILDGKVYAAKAPNSDSLSPLTKIGETKAALLVGFHVEKWNKYEIASDVSPNELESYIERQAQVTGIDTSRPFPFVIEGTLADLHLHVIRGACPVHSKRNGIELGEDTKPYHGHHDSLEGKLFGVFAKDAAGNLTHPGTSTHTHTVYSENETDLTGHVESVGVAKGAILLLPSD